MERNKFIIIESLHKDYKLLNAVNFNLIHRYRIRMYCYATQMTKKQLYSYYNLNKLSGFDWSWLLQDHPELLVYCNWSKLNDNNWDWLLKTHPQLAQYRKG